MNCPKRREFRGPAYFHPQIDLRNTAICLDTLPLPGQSLKMRFLGVRIGLTRAKHRRVANRRSVETPEVGWSLADDEAKVAARVLPKATPRF